MKKEERNSVFSPNFLCVFDDLFFFKKIEQMDGNKLENEFQSLNIRYHSWLTRLVSLQMRKSSLPEGDNERNEIDTVLLPEAQDQVQLHFRALLTVNECLTLQQLCK